MKNNFEKNYKYKIFFGKRFIKRYLIRCKIIREQEKTGK
jgi:hypothetical protein